jgi:hypothetical protein
MAQTDRPPEFLMFDAADNLYGTAGGGAYGAGVTHELIPRPSGAWTQRILHAIGDCAVAPGTVGEGGNVNGLFGGCLR